MKNKKILSILLSVTVILSIVSTIDIKKVFAVGPTSVIGVSTGYRHTLLINSDKTLWASGYNSSGQIGNGTIVSSPILKQTLTDVIAVEAENDNSFAIKSAGTLWVAGANNHGQLGDGTIVSVKTWKQVLTTVSQVSAGTNHSLAVKSNGTLWATGSNASGQMGGTTPANIGLATDTKVWKQLLTGVKQAGAGDSHSLALKTDGTLWGVGGNGSGGLGDGTTATSHEWKQLLTGVAQISTTYGVSMALKTDGTLWTTGNNPGDGINSNVKTWTQTLTDVTKISAGEYHSMALKSDGTLWVTGYNNKGQFGDGTNINNKAWKQVLTDVKMFDNGITSEYSLAVKTNGSLWATGNNDRGQHGDGTIVSKTTWTMILPIVVNVAPTLTVTNPITNSRYSPGDNMPLTGTLVDVGGTSSFNMNVNYNIDGGTTVVLPNIVDNDVSTPYSYNISLPTDIALGTHTLNIWSSDSEGAVGTVQSVSFKAYRNASKVTGTTASSTVTTTTITGSLSVNFNDSGLLKRVNASVTKAEYLKTPASKITAQASVNRLTFSTDKTNLQNRVNLLP